MQYKKETDYIISLLKCAVTSTTASMPPVDLNWNILYKIAKHHRVYSTLYFALNTLPEQIKQSIPNFKDYELAYKKYIVIDTNRNFYWSLLREDFEAYGVDYILLKGSVSKYLYPDTSMRVMRDIDILYRNIDDDTLIDIFKKYEFEVSKKEPKEISFVKPSLKLAIEVQTKLIDEGYDNWYQYLDNIWDKCKQQEGHEYVMTNEDFCLYHLIHMAKHFINGGIGINHILDTYIIKNTYTNLDEFYIKKELESLGLLKFYNNICKLIDVWFNETELLNLNKEDIDNLNLLTKYIIRGGSFGSLIQKEANTVVSGNNKKASLVRRIFPDITTITNYYGNTIKKHKWMLPLYWIKLNINRLKRGNTNFKKSISNINNITDDRIKTTEELFKYCGLK